MRPRIIQFRAKTSFFVRLRFGIGSGCENPMAAEIARAAEVTAPAKAFTKLGVTLVTGPDTLTAAIGAPLEFRTGALTHRAPCTASSSSTA